MGRGWISGGNSTTVPLAANATFTGAADLCTDYSSFAVTWLSDQASAAGGVTFEFSQDGTNWDRVKTVTSTANDAHLHNLAVITRYFRLVYINGAVAQTSFRLQTLYHTDKAHTVTSGAQQVLHDHDDVQLVRPTSNAELDANTGRFNYMSTVSVFGSNTAVGSGAVEDIWEVGGVYPWPQAAVALRVKSGGNAADGVSGAGIQTITIEGLDENWEAASESLTLAGTSASSPTTTTFIRVFRVYGTSNGTYTGANTALITVETTGDVTVASITLGEGESQLGLYTIPAGKTGYLRRVAAEVTATASKTATITLWQRRNADDVATPFYPKRLVVKYSSVTGEVFDDHHAWPSFPEKTDIWFSAIGEATTAVDVEMDLFLVDD